MSEVVSKKEMSSLPKILAVDFDGTLVEDCYPHIGTINERNLNLVNSYKEKGYKIVLWTCRDGELLDAAVKLCKENGLEFDAVNQNVKEVREMFNNDTRKVYADIYLDDKSWAAL